jgi:hypothetical protein
MIVTMSTVGCVCDMIFVSHTDGHTDRQTDGHAHDTHSYGDIKPTTPLSQIFVSLIIIVAWIYIPYEISKLFQVSRLLSVCAHLRLRVHTHTYRPTHPQNHTHKPHQTHKQTNRKQVLSTRSQYRTRVPRFSHAAKARRPGHVLVLGDVTNVYKLQKFVSEFYHPDRCVI